MVSCWLLTSSFRGMGGQGQAPSKTTATSPRGAEVGETEAMGETEAVGGEFNSGKQQRCRQVMVN